MSKPARPAALSAHLHYSLKPGAQRGANIDNPLFDLMLADAHDERQQLLTIYAGHDVALSVLQQHAATAAGLHLDLRVAGSVDCLHALNASQCVVAGFHVPAARDAGSSYAQAMKPLLKPGLHKVIGFCRRQQGLMLRPEHARSVHTLADISQQQLRFVNRQVGSGTRLLMDHLQQQQGLALAQLPGYHDQIEQTHVAVAAHVAAGLADVGLGIEAAAIEFGLHFVPLVSEDYFLACLKPSLDTPAVQRLCEVLASEAWKKLMGALPGYALGSAPGRVLTMTTALPWWNYEGSARKKRSISAEASGPRASV